MSRPIKDGPRFSVRSPFAPLSVERFLFPRSHLGVVPFDPPIEWNRLITILVSSAPFSFSFDASLRLNSARKKGGPIFLLLTRFISFFFVCVMEADNRTDESKSFRIKREK